MSNNRVKVEGESGLYRDLNSGGIISDDVSFVRYKEERQKRIKSLSQEAKINSLEKEVGEIKSQLSEIISILRSK